MEDPLTTAKCPSTLILAAATTHEQPLSTMVQNSDASTSCDSQGSHRERPYEYMNRNHISQGTGTATGRWLLTVLYWQKARFI